MRDPITAICPICQQDLGAGHITTTDASEALAQHIFREHTKHKKGQQAVLQIPVEQATHLTMAEKDTIQIFGHLNPSREERRRYAKQLRGNSHGRPQR